MITDSHAAVFIIENAFFAVILTSDADQAEGGVVLRHLPLTSGLPPHVRRMSFALFGELIAEGEAVPVEMGPLQTVAERSSERPSVPQRRRHGERVAKHPAERRLPRSRSPDSAAPMQAKMGL